VARRLEPPSQSAFLFLLQCLLNIFPFILKSSKSSIFNPQSLKGEVYLSLLSLSGGSDQLCQGCSWPLLDSKVRSRTLPKKHLKNSTSQITKKCSNGLQNDSKIDQKWSPWEVRKGSGRQVATKSANINYNNYLLHFSDVLPFAKPLILTIFETKRH